MKTQSNCDRVKIVDLKSCISLATKRWIPLDCLGQQHSLCKFTKSFWLSSFRLDEFRWEYRIKPESVNVDVILLDFHLEFVSVRRNFWLILRSGNFEKIDWNQFLEEHNARLLVVRKYFWTEQRRLWIRNCAKNGKSPRFRRSFGCIWKSDEVKCRIKVVKIDERRQFARTFGIYGIFADQSGTEPESVLHQI